MENVQVEAVRTTNNLYCKTGKINEYRRAFHRGLGATIREETFDKSLGVRGGHKCCGSKVSWRHKVSCDRLSGEGNEKWKALGD